jgi:hypothetical protein
VAAVFRSLPDGDFALGEEFSVGTGAPFVAPQDGELFLRCGDAWTELGDNAGELSVTVRRVGAP